MTVCPFVCAMRHDGSMRRFAFIFVLKDKRDIVRDGRIAPDQYVDIVVIRSEVPAEYIGARPCRQYGFPVFTDYFAGMRVFIFQYHMKVQCPSPYAQRGKLSKIMRTQPFSSPVSRVHAGLHSVCIRPLLPSARQRPLLHTAGAPR